MTTEVPILLVEDDDAHRRLASRAFRQRVDGGYRLIVAGTLAQARELMSKEAISLVLVDLLLPDGRGTDLLYETRDQIPLVVLTSYGDEQAAVDAIKSGALDYVVKTESTLLQLPQIAQRALREWGHVDARQRTETQLRKSEERFRRIVETAQEGIWAFGADNKTTFANKTLAEMLGYSLEQMTGREPFEMVDAEDREQFDAKLAHCREGQSEAFELRFLHRDGHSIWTRLAVSPILGEANEYVGMLFMVADIGEQKKAEAALRTLESQLAQVSRVSAIGELMAELAHEVNQPLYAISNYAIGCAKTLENSDNQPTDKVISWVKEIVVQANRAGDIIRRIRDLTRKGESHRSRETLGDIVRKTIDFAAADLRKNDVEVKVIVEEDQDEVVVDRVQIQQVLLNLLQNGCDSMRKRNSGRVLTVCVSSHERDMEVSVADNGAGLSDTDGERIFNAFFTNKPDAMGMGLAVSRTIIRSHGGQIWAAVDVDQGARFHFRLPRAGRSLS